MPKKAVKNKQKNTQKNNQTEKLLIALIALVLGLGGGIGIAAVANSDGSSSNVEMTEMTTHSHSSIYEVSEEEAPTVDFIVEEDAKSGWNIKIITTRFRFAPENVNKQNITGEGHAHLYVDGEKVARVYGEYFHYPVDFDGSKTFEITLNANDHTEYSVNGESIKASQQVSHDHSETPHMDDHMHDE